MKQPEFVCYQLQQLTSPCPYANSQSAFCSFYIFSCLGPYMLIPQPPLQWPTLKWSLFQSQPVPFQYNADVVHLSVLLHVCSWQHCSASSCNDSHKLCIVLPLPLRAFVLNLLVVYRLPNCSTATEELPRSIMGKKLRKVYQFHVPCQQLWVEVTRPWSFWWGCTWKGLMQQSSNKSVYSLVLGL